MNARKVTCAVATIALALAVLPLSAVGATEDDAPVEESPLSVELDRELVNPGDDVELDISYEVDAAEEAEPVVEAAEEVVTEPTVEEPFTVTFTVDPGDGSAVQEHVVEDAAAGDDIDADLELVLTYDTVDTYAIVVTATPAGGETATATVSVEVTDEPVVRPRSGKFACPDTDDTDETDDGEAGTEDELGEGTGEELDEGAGEELDEGVEEGTDEVVAAARPTTRPARPASALFADVPEGSHHGHYIACLARAGLVSGLTPAQYAPGRSVTREQMATLLVRAIERSGVELPAGEDAFDDDDGSYHEDNIDALAAAGLVQGSGLGDFRPTAPVSREQMASFLTRVYEHIAGKTLTSEHDYFGDDESSVHEDRINHAAAAGFAAGTERGAFAPGRQVSREQIATFLARMLDRLVEEDGVTI